MRNDIYYTLSQIANKLTKSLHTSVITKERVWQWIQHDGLKAERIPESIRGVSYKPYWIKEKDLREFLDKKGWNTANIFD
jgi:hypothetical protein